MENKRDKVPIFTVVLSSDKEGLGENKTSKNKDN